MSAEPRFSAFFSSPGKFIRIQDMELIVAAKTRFRIDLRLSSLEDAKRRGGSVRQWAFVNHETNCSVEPVESLKCVFKRRKCKQFLSGFHGSFGKNEGILRKPGLAFLKMKE